MDFLEYTNRRIVMADQRTLNLILGYSFIGAGLILLMSLVKTDRYYLFGIMLIGAGVAFLTLSSEQTYVTLDGESRQLEIQRRPLVGKIQITRVSFDEVAGIRTVQKDPSKRLLYRVEVELKGQGWVPLTRPFLRDLYGFETTENKLRAFLEAAAAPI